MSEAERTRLQRLTAFLKDPAVSSLIYTHVATLFSADEGGRIGFAPVASEVVRSEWWNWALGHAGKEERQQCLKRIAHGDLSDDMPRSLVDFIKSCQALQLERACSDEPLLSSRPAAPKPASRRKIAFDSLGMKTKKAHEVERCLGIVDELVDRRTEASVLDIGAGRAHLSRTLTREPINAHVLAIDNSDSQLKGADRLVDLTNRFNGPLGLFQQPIGSLKHELSHLDGASLEQLLQRWPAKSAAPTPPLVLALHACGDLTVNTLRALVHTMRARADLRACIVGCCYNLLSDSSFPLCGDMAGVDLQLGRDARMLAAQAPSQWILDDEKRPGTMLSLRKLAFRARLGAELRYYGLNDETRNERVGRPPNNAYVSYETFRPVALKRLGIEESLPMLDMGEHDWDTLAFSVAFFWSLRALIGPVIESLIILDRYIFLADELAGSKYTVELHALFAQDKESLRNMALVVR